MGEGTAEIAVMLDHLRKRFAEDPEARITAKLTRWLADPLKPQDRNGRFRPSPVLLIMLASGLTAASAFLYFGYWAQ